MIRKELLMMTVVESEGKRGLRELRAAFPEDYFFWRKGVGMVVFCRENTGLTSRMMEMADYVEVLGADQRVFKNRKGRTGQNATMLSDEMIPGEAAVIRIMES